MQKYIEVVKDYIERPQTNYALMISGEWGNGKTYFLNNSIFPMLENMGKKPIYITLNGLSTTEEVSKQIYLETSLFSNEKIKNFMESKTVKHITQFSKVIHNVATTFNFAGTSENNINYDELINIKNNVVLCFDDLERCKIEITEILGYINNFVEHDDFKTIIIGNEKEIKDINIEQNKELKMLTAINSLEAQQELNKEIILKQLSSLFTEQKSYDVIKEKIIGKTLFYVPDISAVIDDIIAEYNRSNTANYYTFLKENKEDILYIFNQSERKNIRLLKHALSDFTKIHQTLYVQLEENKYKKKLIFKYFIPALISSIEYRSGSFNSEILSKTPTTKISNSYLTFYNRAIESEVFNRYLKGYTKEEELYSSQFINIYISSSILETESIINESKDIIKTWYEKDTMSEPRSSIQKLTDGFLELENDEFEECVQDVLSKVAAGYYPLNHYVRIFYQIETLFENSLLDKSIEDIIHLFKSGIEATKQVSLTDDRFERFYINENNKSSYLKSIEDLVTTHKKHAMDNYLKDTITSMTNPLPDNINKFTNQYYELARSNEFKPLMQYINVEEFSSQIIRLSNYNISSIRRLFHSIYDFSNIKEFFEEDYKYIVQLANSLEKHLPTTKSIHQFTLNLLVKDLNEIASRLK
ncbi:KAP family NTPase [Bacillus cereus]|nr:KAP family NTPase [Bacillus cereus]